MSTSSFSVSLSEPARAYIDAQVELSGYASASDYIESLVNQDQIWHSTRTEERLVAAIDSPDLNISQDELDGRPLVNLLREKLK